METGRRSILSLIYSQSHVSSEVRPEVEGGRGQQPPDLWLHTPKGEAGITCTEENRTTRTESTMGIWYLESHRMTS